MKNRSTKVRSCFVPTNQDLANILGRTDLHSENFIFWDSCWISDFQISEFPASQIPWPEGGGGDSGRLLAALPDLKVEEIQGTRPRP